MAYRLGLGLYCYRQLSSLLWKQILQQIHGTEGITRRDSSSCLGDDKDNLREVWIPKTDHDRQMTTINRTKSLMYGKELENAEFQQRYKIPFVRIRTIVRQRDRSKYSQTNRERGEMYLK